MPGSLSPVMLLAQTGLLSGAALRVSPDLTGNITLYTDLTVISQLTSVINTAQGNVANSTLANLETLGSNTLPALTNTVPVDYRAVFTANAQPVLATAYAQGLTGAISNRANTIMGSGDLSLFSQIYQTSDIYRAQSNEILVTLTNAPGVNATYRGMSSLSTSGIYDLNTDLVSLARDLAALGQMINLAELNLLGLPSALLRQTIRRGNGGILPNLELQLRLQGIDRALLLEIIDTPVPTLATDTEAAIYRAMAGVQGADLAQILEILEVTQTGFVSMADLLDPAQIFRSSYLTMTVPWVLGTLPVYIAPNTVNPQLGEVFGVAGPCAVRGKIQPAGQALASEVIGRGLQGVQNISALSLPEFAQAVLSAETYVDLALIQALPQAVSTATIADLREAVAPTLTAGADTIPVSTGTSNTFVISDFIGTAAGYPHAAALQSVTLALTQLTDQGDLANLTAANTGAYATMAAVLAGNLTLVPPWGSGTYSNVSVALDAVIANTDIEIARIAASTDLTPDLNAAWASMAAQLVREEYNQGLAHVQLDELTSNSLPTTMSLAAQLHDIGLSTAPRDSADFFVATANTLDVSGQAVVASLREGRTIRALENQGIGVYTNIPNTLG